MRRHYTHLLPILILAWTLYGQCQEDTYLPLSASAIILISYLWRLKSGDQDFAWMQRVPLAGVFVISLIGGIIWRFFTPAPSLASAMYIDIISVWQSFTVIAAVLLWLKPYSLKNVYWITAFSWACVALSINVPFDEQKLQLFRVFCILSAINILIHTVKNPPLQNRYALHCRQLLIFGLLLMMITGFIFKNIAFGLRVFDQMFMSFIGDYLMPQDYTNFLRISPFLQLTNPGFSAIDRRPVLEVDSLGFPNIYLKTQVFETYQDGQWKEPNNVPRSDLKGKLDTHLLKTNMLMYVPLQDIIPSAYVVAAIEGLDDFSQDTNDIVYTQNARRTRVLSFSLSGPKEIIIEPDSEEFRSLTAIPESLRQPLTELGAQIVTESTTNFEKAMALQEYFRSNFKYTLNVDFQATEKGILKMIQEKKPAYCSYFATAMTLMLRSQGIPARVAVGFQTQEKTGYKNSRFLVRVRNAHAWTEAFLPYEDRASHRTYFTWVPVDATPSDLLSKVVGGGDSRLNYLADKLRLFILRNTARLSNIDKEQAQKATLLILLSILFLMNAKKLIGNIRLRIFSKVKIRHSLRKRSDIDLIYERYENYIERAFQEKRKHEETDGQLLKRLAEKGPIPPKTFQEIQSFIDSYQATRFGGQPNHQLENILQSLEKKKTAPG